jgi:hypothetical protein
LGVGQEEPEVPVGVEEGEGAGGVPVGELAAPSAVVVTAVLVSVLASEEEGDSVAGFPSLSDPDGGFSFSE